MLKSELRKDYIQEKYVIISPRRGQRPHKPSVHESFSDDEHPQQACSAFCPKNVNPNNVITQVGRGRKWRIAVIPNKFPAVTLNNPKAYGKQEVVIETPDHNKHLDELSVSHIERLIRVYAERTREISKNKKIEYILIFKNEGRVAGASIHHAHSQIFATHFLPPHLFDKAQQIQNYKLEHGTCVYCDVIERETNGPRRVFVNHHVVAFCPYASMHNYEVWILPRRHIDNVMLLNVLERREFAKILKMILPKIRALGLPYNYYFHQVVFDEDQHLYLKIIPRGSVWAGVEIGSGIVINAVPPENAAKYYRTESAKGG